MKLIKGLTAFVAITILQLAALLALFLIGMKAGEAMRGDVAVGVGAAFVVIGWIASEWLLRRTRLEPFRVSQNPIFHLNV